MRYLIGIDLGTSATKTVLFDELGNAICSSSEEYALSQPKNGWAEQNPEDWFAAAVKTIKYVLANSGVDSNDVVSLGISGQMHGLVMLDEHGEVLRPAILWCDQRTGEECEDITNIVGRERLIEITANPALTGFTASKILWVRKHEPELYAKCRHILLPKDYLRFRLTGDFATDVSDASGMQLLDVKARKWSNELLVLLNIDKDMLGKVYESCEVTGHISREIAKLIGLSENTLVVGGAGDNAAAAVGTGVVSSGKAFTTIGTSGVVYAHLDKPIIDMQGRVHTFCCAVPNAWHVMGVTQAAGLSLNWFANNFCEEEKAQAKEQNTSVYKLIDEQVKNVAIGADRLLYLPYLMGERTPHLNPDCRGVFFGLSAMHTKAHLARAVMEGVTYSLNDCLSVLCEMNIHPSSMLATGGGAKSDVWRHMLADSFDLPVCTVKSEEGPALGMAILAAVGAGIYRSVEEACEKMIRYSDLITAPNSKKTSEYHKYYKLYRELYPSMKVQFGELAKQ